MDDGEPHQVRVRAAQAQVEDGRAGEGERERFTLGCTPVWVVREVALVL